MPQQALVQDVPEHGRVLAVEDRLALEPGADRMVDGRAAVLWLARAGRLGSDFSAKSSPSRARGTACTTPIERALSMMDS
jgi:hypothetical protein